MEAQIANDALIAVWVLPENVLDYDDNLFNDILRCNFRPNQLLKGKDASFCCLLNLHSNDAHGRDGLPGKSDVDFLSVVF